MFQRAIIALVVTFAPLSAHAADIDADPTNYRTMFDTVGPGDTLRLAPGDYRDCLTVSGKHGSDALRIIIEGADVFGGGVVFYGANCTGIRNATIFIEDSSYITIRNIEISLEQNLSNGIRAGYGDTPVHNVTVTGMYIHDNDANNQHSAVGVFATSWDWHIHNNRFERNGLGMYLGDSDGTAPFIRGTIERNLILNPQGYGFQIKHQVVRNDVTGMPQTDSVTVIRRNAIIKAANAAMGPDARPNLLIGDVPPSGIGANDRYEIYQNFFFENASDVEPLFQGEGRLSIHDNIFVNSFSAPGIVVRPHEGQVRDVAIFHNTIVTVGTAASVTGRAARIDANAAYSDDNMIFIGGTPMNNATGSRAEAASVFANTTPTLGQLDLYPVAESPLRLDDPIDLGAIDDVMDGTVDFNGNTRSGRWRGAYAGFGTNPGWTPAAEIPPMAAVPIPYDGGMGPTRDGGVVPTRDGGTANDRDGGTTIDRDAGTEGPKPMVDEDEGCSCSNGRRDRATPGLWLLLVVPLMGCVARSSSSSRSRS